jgi:hypothetical protein
METSTLKKSIKSIKPIETIEWTQPYNGTEITIEDYRRDMSEAEFSGDMTFNQFQNSMNEWLAQNL